MKTTSKNAYTKGQIQFWTHRNIITEAMKDGQKRTFREIAAKVRLTNEQVWKRVSELEADGTFISVGTKDFNGNQNTLYQYNFDGRNSTKKQSFTAFAKEVHPDWITEYEIKVLHKLP